MIDEQIATELRALRETPSERFAAELDAWAAAGFPAAQDAARPAARRQRPGLAERLSGVRIGRLLPVMGAAATLVLIAVAVGVSSLEDPEDRGTGPESATVEESQDRGAEGRGAGGDAAIEPAPTTIAPSPPLPPQDSELKPGQERVQEKSASMTLSTEPDEVADVADGVIEVTERYEGIVVSSNVSTSDGTGRAGFDLRIPSANLQAALADLSDLASVSS